MNQNQEISKIEIYFADFKFPETITDVFSYDYPVKSHYSFDTYKDFIEKWHKLCKNPDSRWYWVLLDGCVICSGSCDPQDIEIFKDYFEEEN